jgi:hypothetical protein
MTRQWSETKAHTQGVRVCSRPRSPKRSAASDRRRREKRGIHRGSAVIQCCERRKGRHSADKHIAPRSSGWRFPQCCPSSHRPAQRSRSSDNFAPARSQSPQVETAPGCSRELPSTPGLCSPECYLWWNCRWERPLFKVLAFSSKCEPRRNRVAQRVSRCRARRRPATRPALLLESTLSS